MSRTGVGIRVMVGGRRLDDGCVDYGSEPNPIGPGLVADEGLAVVWGRRTTVDQPAPSTCTFSVTDTAAAPAYFDALTLGATVEVFGDATTSPSGTMVQTFTDPGFEAGVNGFGTSSAVTVTRSTHRAHGGAASVAIQPNTLSTPWGAILAPGPLEVTGGNPAAWDAIPATRAGFTWRIEAWVWVPHEVTVHVAPALFSAPFATSAAPVTGAGVTVPAADTARWVSVGFDFAPGVNDRWVGLSVSAIQGGVAWDALDPTLTWDALDPTLTWDDLGTVFLDDVAVWAPEGAVGTSVLVFSGRITDLESAWDEAADAAVVSVTASDFLAELGNRFVGDEPWPVEAAGDRIRRVLTLAATGGPPITSDIAPTLDPIPVGWVDIDRQAAANVLTDTTQSVDGVLWSATHITTGPFVKVEDTGTRLPGYSLTMVGGVIIVGPALFPPDADPAPVPVSACDVMRDPVRFNLEVADIATRVSVSWQEQTTDDEGQPAPTDRTVMVVNPDREVVAGSRAASVATILTTAAAATSVADRLLARLAGLWRIEGVRIADDDIPTPDEAAAHLFLTLLNGVLRGGLPLDLTDMPAWSPLGTRVPAYLEGGEYRYQNGGWDLSLMVSRANGVGTSAAWDELPPEWQWDQFDPTLTWDELRGVSAP